MTPYSFYCSRCKISHAGECPPAKAACETPAGLYPAVGSIWRHEGWRDGDGWVLTSLYRVVGFDAAESFTVTVVGIAPKSGPLPCPREMWDPAGYKSDYGSRVRFVAP